jgi:hypothetical protein
MNTWFERATELHGVDLACKDFRKSYAYPDPLQRFSLARASSPHIAAKIRTRFPPHGRTNLCPGHS